MMEFSIIFLCALIVATYSAKLPANFQKCHRNQPDLKECILKAAQNGITQLEHQIPNFRLPSLNPFILSSAIIGGKGAVAVEQKFKDCKLWGLWDTKFSQFEFDFEKKTLNITTVFKEIKKECQYELDGRVLLLPIKGKGPSTIILRTLHTKVFMRYEEVKKNGKTYIKFVSGELQLDPEFMSFNFENLFNGDKRLGDNINSVLNENWKEVFDDVREGYLKLIQEVVVNVFNSFFAKVSLDEALN